MSGQTVADSEYLGLIRDLPWQPIFIVGNHRSGTTFLHHLIHASGAFNVLTIYHVLRYPEILANFVSGNQELAKQRLADEFRAAGAFKHGIHNIPLTPDFPEEYGFALHERTVIDGLKWMRPPRINSENCAKFSELCRKIQFTGDRGKPILLKNPWDFTNILEVKRLVPHAKMVVLHRHPVRVINSQIKAVQQVLGEKNTCIAMLSKGYVDAFRRPLLLRLMRWLANPNRKFAVRGFIRRHANAVATAQKQLSQIPPSDRIDVRYEEMCERPGAVVQTVLDWLGLKGDPNIDYGAMVQPRAGPLLPVLAGLQDELAHRMSDYYRAYGYATKEV